MWFTTKITSCRVATINLLWSMYDVMPITRAKSSLPPNVVKDRIVILAIVTEKSNNEGETCLLEHEPCQNCVYWSWNSMFAWVICLFFRKWFNDWDFESLLCTEFLDKGPSEEIYYTEVLNTSPVLRFFAWIQQLYYALHVLIYSLEDCFVHLDCHVFPQVHIRYFTYWKKVHLEHSGTLRIWIHLVYTCKYPSSR